MRHQESERNPYTAPTAPAAGEEPPRRRWRWKIAIGLAAVIAIVYLIVASIQGLYERVVPGAALSGRSTSMEPVNLELVDKEAGKALRLRVPKAYLIDVKNWKGGAQRFITMRARLSTMQPATQGVPDVESGGGLADDPIVSIFLEGVHVDDGFLERHYQQEARRYNKPQSGAFGLEHYLREVCHPATGECRLDPTEFFASPLRGPPEERINLSCDRPEVYPGRRCKAVTRFDGFLAQYTFPRDQLSEWRATHESVHRLLKSFVSG